MLYIEHDKPNHIPWNKGKITGQKPPLKLNEVWACKHHPKPEAICRILKYPKFTPL